MSNKFGVDRAKFLAVATAIAGLASFQACTTTDKADDAGDGGAETTDGGSKSTAGTESMSGGNDAEAGQGGASGGSGGGAAEGGAAEGGAAQAGAAQGGASEAGAGGAAMCDDTVGDPACEGTSEMCHHYCLAAVAHLKPAAAEAAVTCLLADTTENCDGGYECLSNATAKGCAEDVSATCEAAVAGCSSAEEDKPSCEQLLSGLNETGLTAAKDCIATDCYSVYSCAEGLFFEN
jgi:hypothetical protein